MTFGSVLAQVDQLLRKEQIPYAVIGAFAVAAWGAIRATRDLDLLIEIDELDRLSEAIIRLGWSCSKKRGDARDPIRGVLRVQISSGDDFQEIDFIGGIRDAPPGIIERAREVRFEDLSLPVASPEDMVILKLLAGSAQDIEDIRDILRVRGERISKDSIRRLCPAALIEKLHELIGR